MRSASNLFVSEGVPRGTETIEPLLETRACRLERIVSRGKCSPDGFWYDQTESEWVLLMKGTAVLRFESGEVLHLTAGDHLIIPAHRRHRVDRVCEDAVWLALHYQDV